MSKGVGTFACDISKVLCTFPVKVGWNPGKKGLCRLYLGMQKLLCIGPHMMGIFFVVVVFNW